MSFASPSTTASSEELISSSDTGVLASFIYGITSYNITIPVWLQITMIIITMILLITGGYFAYDTFDIKYTRSGFMWFIFIAFLNLITILMVLIYYNNKKSPATYTGLSGRAGKKGNMGKAGTSVSCNYCQNNIYLQRVKIADPIATLSTYTSAFQRTSDNIKYFNNIISQGNINYDSFVNGIVLGKNVDPSQVDSIARFRSLMEPTSIAIYLIENVNANITKSSTRTYGTFKTPGIKIGFTSLGDSVYGGSENFALNSFMVNGDYMHPPSYRLLVSLPTYNETTGDSETYSIWRPNPQSVSVAGFKSKADKSSSKPMKKVVYNGLGDVCRAGTTMPVLNDIAILNENCLDPVPSSDLTLIFIYVGNIQINDDSSKIDYTQTDSYLIQNNVIQNDIEIFSVWRTPLNTFITNCNADNELINGSILYNMVSSMNDSLTEYGSVSSSTKANIIIILQSVNVPKILAASTICRHYEIELHKDLIYYVNKYMHADKESLSMVLSMFKKTDVQLIQGLNERTLGEYMKFLGEIIQLYDDYNAKLIKQANIDLGTSSGTSYDPSKEVRFPPYLLNAYNIAQTQLSTISVKIENTNTFLDLINVLFDNSLETRIAIDSDGIAEGGILLNGIQETIVRICKMIMPPTKQAYTIKDECLGTFALDRDREEVIKEFTNIYNLYYKLLDSLLDNLSSDSKNDKLVKNIGQMEILMENKVGQLCGYIANYMKKINTMQLDEFTTSRIKGLKQIYGDMVKYLNTLKNNI
jgi:hypothetical protein